MSPTCVLGIQHVVSEYVKAAPAGIRVLDAGCGGLTRLRLPDTAEITGIDVDAEQLARNRSVHTKILGDIQTYTTDERYDITVCWDLLEHLEHPEKAVSRLLTWTKPNGLIIIVVPNVFSLKGLITKLTPYWFHKWVYTNLYGYDGKPFKTYLRFSISPGRLCSFFEGNQIEYMGFESHRFRKSYLNAIYKSITTGIRVLCLGKYDPRRGELYLVVRKTQPLPNP